MGRKKHYGYEPCIACGKSISQNGGAYTFHFNKHIRAGEMEKLPTGGYRVIKAAEHSLYADAVVCVCKKKFYSGIGEVLIVGDCPIHRAGKA